MYLYAKLKQNKFYKYVLRVISIGTDIEKILSEWNTDSVKNKRMRIKIRKIS